MNDEKLVTAIATATRIKATRELSTVTIIVLFFLSIGSSLLFTNTNKTTATIQSTSCENPDGSCTINVQYNIQDQSYTSSFNTTDHSLLNKTTIDINYNTNNPSDINYNQMSPKFAGIITIIIALLGCAGFGYYYYTIMTNKNFATQQALNKIIRSTY